VRRLAILGALVAVLLMVAFALPGRASADPPTTAICIVFIPTGDDVFLVEFGEVRVITNPSGETISVCRGESGFEPAEPIRIEQGACTLTVTPGGTFTNICRT